VSENRTWKVVVTDSGFPDLEPERNVLEPLGAHLEALQCRTAEEAASACADADAVLTQWAPITAEVIRRMERCKVIVRYGIGVDNVDLEAARERGIPVVNVPDYAINEVADHTLALLLASVRKIPQIVNKVRRGEWEIAPCRPIQGLQGKRLGVAGFGNIARAVVRRASAFGIEAIAYDPFLNEEQVREHGATKVDWQELLQQSDLLSIHLPLTEKTRHAFNDEAFNLMKPSSYLINTSRGGVVDTDALVRALREGRLSGAAVDVLETEPIAPDHPLLNLEQCLVTSHCAWYSENSLLRLQAYAAEEVKRVLEGGKPKHIVNGVTL
jgi:D-3-phosphoglycerate dehydrogenase